MRGIVEHAARRRFDDFHVADAAVHADAELHDHVTLGLGAAYLRGATGVTRLTILAGDTSTGAGGSGGQRGRVGHWHGGRAGSIGGWSVDGAGRRSCAAGGGGAARPTAESLASTVRPGKELSVRRMVVAGGELIGASSG